MDEKAECSICNHSFDSDIHRPRVLPCGHGFCTQCIQTCIDIGNNACSVCRKNHGANSATDLPVFFLLEEFLRKATISVAQAQEPFPAQADQVVMCPEHFGVPLHFHCNTHGKEICHSCAVIDHPPTSCQLISTKEKMKEMKASDIETIQQGKRWLKNTEDDLDQLFQEEQNILTLEEKNKQDLEQEVQSLLNKIEQSNKKINEVKKSKQHIKNSIEKCQEKYKSMDSLESKLKTAENHQAILKECANTQREISNMKKWEEEFRKELELNIQSLILGKSQFVQITRKGVSRFSKVIYENGLIFIPSLTKDITPPSSVKLLKESEFPHNSLNSKVVFLELSAPEGNCLGRVIIDVQGDTSYGEQFIMLALGTEGPTYKKARFDNRGCSYIRVLHYVTEKGSHTNSALLPLTSLPYEKQSRGAVRASVSSTGSFAIATQESSFESDEFFGRVVEGMDIIDRVASDEFMISDVCVSDCGIILNY